jgi:hypothetical protein
LDRAITVAGITPVGGIAGMAAITITTGMAAIGAIAITATVAGVIADFACCGREMTFVRSTLSS